MKVIIVNGKKYEYRCISTQQRAINNTVGILMQMEVFHDGRVLDKKEVKGYLLEKIEEHIRELII